MYVMPRFYCFRLPTFAVLFVFMQSDVIGEITIIFCLLFFLLLSGKKSQPYPAPTFFFPFFSTFHQYPSVDQTEMKLPDMSKCIQPRIVKVTKFFCSKKKSLQTRGNWYFFFSFFFSLMKFTRNKPIIEELYTLRHIVMKRQTSGAFPRTFRRAS